MRAKLAYLVVLNYNDFDTTDAFLKRAVKLHEIDGIIVVDNCSTDESYTALKREYRKSVSILQTDRNNGYAAGNNYGIRYAISKFAASIIFVANPDTTISDEAIAEISSVFNDNPDAGVVSCKMQSNASYNAPLAWKLPTYWDCLKEAVPGSEKLFKVRNIYSDSYLSSDQPVKVDVLPGSFFAISAKAFNDVDGLDESTFLFYEENILACKIASKGYNSYLVPTCSYRHDHSVSIDKEYGRSLTKFRIAHESRKIYCCKYLGIGLIKQICLSLVFCLGLGAYCLVTLFSKSHR